MTACSSVADEELEDLVQRLLDKLESTSDKVRRHQRHDSRKFVSPVGLPAVLTIELLVGAIVASMRDGAPS